MRRIIIASILSAAIMLGGITAYRSLTAQSASASPSPSTLVGGRLIPIVGGANVTKDQSSALGGFVNVSDCEALDLYITATMVNSSPQPSNQPWINPHLSLSSDGVTPFAPTMGANFVPIVAGDVDGTTKAWNARFNWNTRSSSLFPASPFVQFGVDVSYADATNITAQLYCTTSTFSGSVGGIAEQPNLPARVGGGDPMSYGLGAFVLSIVAAVAAGAWYVRGAR